MGTYLGFSARRRALVQRAAVDGNRNPARVERLDGYALVVRGLVRQLHLLIRRVLNVQDQVATLRPKKSSYKIPGVTVRNSKASLVSFRALTWHQVARPTR